MAFLFVEDKGSPRTGSQRIVSYLQNVGGAAMNSMQRELLSFLQLRAGPPLCAIRRKSLGHSISILRLKWQALRQEVSSYHFPGRPECRSFSLTLRHDAFRRPRMSTQIVLTPDRYRRQ